MKPYYIYLRKSRKDREAEAYGEGETLARHERALMNFAKGKLFNVTKIFREVVSGETIASRPEMQKLLFEVEQGIPAGVLVMEVERLARGATKDQGTVAEAFKYGNVQIITPGKTYDPNNEFDEEYFEFGLFMSRREYKAINRRLQRGRLTSVQEGKYIAGSAPYGYQKVKISGGKGYTLTIIPDQAEVVRLIYSLYIRGKVSSDGKCRRLGISLICRELDTLQIRPLKSEHWSSATIKGILTNPTYIGKIRWQWRRCVKSVENGMLIEHRQKDNDCIISPGLHEAIISDEDFSAAQTALAAHALPAVTEGNILKNPLSGLLRCAKCKKTMTCMKNKGKNPYYRLLCPNRHCTNISAPLYLIEEKLMEGLRNWLSAYQLDWKASLKPEDISLNIRNQAVISREHHLEELKKQLQRTCTLVETGTYSEALFRERSTLLTTEILELTESLNIMRREYEQALAREEPHMSFIPKVKTIPDLYNTLEDAASKNQLLKSILEYVTYEKNSANKKSQRDNANFKLVIYPRIPKHQEKSN